MVNKSFLILSLIFSFFCILPDSYGEFIEGATPAGVADNIRSDTIDVLKYTINLDITDFSGQTIKGNCNVRFTPKLNGTSSISLDLLQLTIDSIVMGNTLNYSYNDTLLVVHLPATLNIGDTATIAVWYHGSPQQDNSGWGGWYWYTNYAFNLGVGFEAIPHVYGRVWHPCFDNFVERAKYEFNIISSGGKVSTCNGELVNETILSGDTIQRTWIMNEEIPSYLACIAVSDYAEVKQIHNGINGAIPVSLFARPNDTTALKSSFINLGAAIDAFENAYGAFKWNKVGYSLVPFSSGAMEHATNIAYPRVAANGSTLYETIMAHELSHHWWGDLVTCDKAEEMWINEGMAVFSEFIFLEYLYGRTSYMDVMRTNHRYVMRYPHNLEGGYQALANVPQEYTYGDHSYKKGADVVHTLRGYLGDSLFFMGLKTFLNNNNYTPVNSIQLRDGLSTATSYNLTDFFNDWVLNPGFAAFSIDSFKVSGSGPYTTDIYIHQRLTGAPNYFNNVPMEITFYNSSWAQYTTTSILSGEFTHLILSVPVNPVYITLNKNNLISQAVTDDMRVLRNPGNNTLSGGLLTLIVDSLPDSALVRVEHYWSAPDPIKDISLKMELSPNRWWRVDGIVPQGYDFRGRIKYDGKVTNGSGGWLDNYLTTEPEDSLHLLYRKGPEDDWIEYPWYTKNMLNNTSDAYGLMEIDSLLMGEYTLARDKFNVGHPDRVDTTNQIVLYPNPNDGRMHLEYRMDDADGFFEIFDLNGKQMMLLQLKSGKNNIGIDATSLAPGTYIYRVFSGHILKSGKIIILNK